MDESREKTMYRLIPQEFITALARHMQAGLKDGRTPYDWEQKALEDPELYKDALLRHLFEGCDYLAVAANAMILWCASTPEYERIFGPDIQEPGEQTVHRDAITPGRNEGYK